MKKFKAKFRLAGLLLALAMSVCCAIAGGILASGTQNASALTGNTTAVSELYGSGKFNSANLTALYKALGGSSVDTYAKLSSKVGNGSIDAGALYTLNGSKNVKVTFGGKTWTVTYVSKTKSGDVIATLWAENPTSATYTFSYNGWYSQYWGYDKTTGIPFNYYSNQYGSSWIRSSVMNIGSAYLKATDGTSGQKTDAQVSITNGTQSTSNEWARFTMDSVANSVKAYLATPSEVAWQEDLYVPAVNGTHRLQSEAYGEPWGGRWYEPSDNASDPRDIRNAPTRIQYSAWKDDPIWLPALSETGWNGVTGYWNTTETQRAYSGTANTWLRSGYTAHTRGAYYLTPAGGISSSYVGGSLAVRPALHLNLKSAADSAAGTATTGKTAVKLPTIEEAKTYNGAEQTFEIQNFNYSLMTFTTTGGGALNGTTVRMTNAGTHTVTYTLRNTTTHCWANGTTAPITLTARINPKTLSPEWSGGSEFTYNGSAQAPTATVAGVDGTALSLAYDFKYSATSSGTKAAGADATAHKIAGYYEATAKFADTQSNYVLDNTAKVKNYTILPKNITVSGSLTIKDKYYDGTKNATVNPAGLTLSGVETADAGNVSVVTPVAGSGYTAQFESAEVGSRYVTVTGLSLTGTAANNYKLVQNTLQSYAQIYPIPLTVTATAANRAYDGTDAAALTAGTFSVGTLNSAIEGTSAALTTVLNTESASGGLTATLKGVFADKNAGNNKAVTVNSALLGGTNAKHFDLSLSAVQTTNSTLKANITKAELTVSLTGLSSNNKYEIAYGDTLTVPYTVSSPVAGETVAIILEYTGTYADGSSLAATTTTPTKAGTFTVTAKIDSTDTNAGNYQLKTGTGIVTSATVEISKAVLTITANAHSITYGTAPSAIGSSGVTYTGFVNGHTAASLSGTLAFDYVIKGTSTAYAQYDGATVAGTTEYEIVPKGLTHADYTVKFVAAPLTVNKYKVTIEIGDGTSVYGASALNMPTINAGELRAADKTAANFKVKLVKGGVDYDPATVLTPNVNALKAGNYAIVAEFTNPNYDVTYTGSQGASGLYTVTKAALTVTADDKSLEYGSAVPTWTATATGAVTGDSNTTLVTGVKFDCVYTSASAVTATGAEYALTPYGLNLDDYEVTYIAGKVTVTPKAVTVTIDNKTGSYGDKFGTLTYTATLINNDNLGLELAIYDSTGAAVTSAIPKAGTYYIKQKTGTTTNKNYTVTISNTDGAGTYIISKKALTVTADNFTVTYGAAKPTYTAQYSGFVNGESESTAGIFGTSTLAFTCSYDPAATNSDKNADTYTITPSGLTADNYTVTFVNGTLTVEQKQIIVALKNQTQVYSGTISVVLNDDGTANYVASNIWELSSITGNTLVSGDSLKITVNAPSSVNAGNYALTANDAQIKTDNPNYKVSVITAQYSITKATLAVKANDYLNTLVYGSAPQESAMSVTYGEDDGSGNTINSFVNGESASQSGVVTAGNRYDFTYKLGMDVYEADGTTQIEYEIIPKGWSAANYDIKYIAGKMTVKPKDVTVKINDLSSIYGEAVKNPNEKGNWTVDAGAVLAGDELGLDLIVVEQGTTTVVTAFDKGVYDIIANTASGATGWTNTNYNVTFESAVRPSDTKGQYSVSAANLTVTANNHTIQYGTANADVGNSGVSYTGWLNGDEADKDTIIAAFTGTVTYTTTYDATTAGKREVGGSYTITPDISALTDPSGNYTFVAGSAAKLTVEKRDITVEIKNQTKEYDGKAYQASDLNPSAYDSKYWAVSSASGNGFASWDAGNEALLGVTLTRGRPTDTNAGLYTITGSVDTTVANSIAANYNVTFENGSFEVTPYEITVYWLKTQDFTLNTDGSDYVAPTEIKYTYDGATSFVPVAQYVDIGGNWATLTTSGARKNAGTTYEAEAYLPNSNNYKFKTAGNDKQHFEVEKCSLTVTWLDGDGNTIANGSVPSYDYRKGVEQGPDVRLTGAPTGVTLTETVDYAVSGKRSAEGNGTVILTILNPNFTVTKAISKCDFKIEKATPQGFQWYDDGGAGGNQLNSVSPKYTYNGESQHPVIKSGTNGSDTYAYALYKEVNGSYVPVTSAIGAGKYKVVATPTSDNYKLDENTAFNGYVEFTIAAKAVDLEWVNVLGDETNGWYFNYNGSVQKPDARLVINSATGEYIGLSVTYSNANSSAVGTGYTASVTLPADGNYALKDASGSPVFTAQITYEIKTNEITVTWDFSNSSWITDDNGEWTASYNGQNLAAVLNKTATMAMTSSNEGVKLEYNVYRVDGGRRVKVANTSNITDAGVYVLAVEFAASNSPSVLANYSIKDGEQQLTVNKLDLTITPANMEVSFGATVTDYELTSSSFSGFLVDTALGVDESSLVNDITTSSNGKIYAAKSGNSWLTSPYTSTTAPGATLTITLTDNTAVLDWLNNILKNYNYTVASTATIKVKAIEGDVKLTGESSVNGDWRYDGTPKLPTAAYKSGTGSGDWTSVDIELVDDPAYTPLVDGKAVNAGTYLVRVIAPHGVQLNNSTLTFQILKRDIHVGIEDRNYTYGEVTQGNYQSKLVWNYAPDTAYNKPMQGDNLAVSLDVTFGTNGFDNGGYAKAGSYRITGSWNGAAYGANYEVTFEGTQTASDGKNSEGLFEIKKAEITVTKQGTQWFNEEGILQKGDYHFISLAAKDDNGAYKFINYSGWQNADVKVEYSADIYNRSQNTAPAPEDETNWSATLPSINRAGEWVVNYKISIDNHEQLRGQWLILIKEEGEYVVIIFQKNYEITYGDELPANLAEELIDGGYVSVSGPLAVADLKRVSTAYAFNGSSDNVSPTTNVGKYPIYFQLDSSVPSNYEVIYKRSNADADSNEDRYVIKPRTLTVEWGETEFKYDGNVHMPENVRLSGWVNGQTLELGGLEVGNTKTYSFSDNGQSNITVSVKADAQYDFKSNGGHQLIVSVDNANYVLDIENAAKTVSISVDGPLTVSDGMPSWLIWVIVAACIVFALIVVILAIIIKKRKATADSDGFYDNVENG